MQVELVAIRVIMRRDKVHVVVRGEEIQHLPKLTGEVEIIILCKIDYIRIALLDQDVNLLRESGTVPDLVESHDHQIIWICIPAEQCFILVRATIQ